MFEPAQHVQALEAALAEHPEDGDACLRLAFLYQVFLDDEARAHACYLRHLVHSLGFTDARDAEQTLARRAREPGAEPVVRLRLGHLRGYAGRVAEAAADMAAGTRWHARRSEHFVIHVVPGSSAHADEACILRQREAGLKRIRRIFGEGLNPTEQIAYYLYESLLHKKILTGDPMPAHAWPKRREVHAVYGPGFTRMSPHEDAHVVLARLGRAPRLLDEGAAEFAARGHAAHGFCRRLLEANGPVAITALLDDAAFDSRNAFLTYSVAGSFTGFLLRSRGAGPFTAFFAQANTGADEAARRLYGTDIASLEAQWRRFLAEAPERPA
jgi:hypothetical protein